jgi:hypothetical protein
VRYRNLVKNDLAAERMGWKPQTLAKSRVTGHGPPFLKVGRLVYYDLEELDAWLLACRRRSTSDPGPEVPAA